MESVAATVARQNSEDFLRLAEERLGKVQSEAGKDYDARKKEVELLVSPIKEHLEKLEKATTEIATIPKRRQKFRCLFILRLSNITAGSVSI